MFQILGCNIKKVNILVWKKVKILTVLTLKWQMVTIFQSLEYVLNTLLLRFFLSKTSYKLGNKLNGFQ